ncbi:hypothetical protein BU17DRAFT_95688 [Hysterangium stoloniferum]|nr:hypothetical protein BU17DRAFT_95688 [Hysterangium stoloniferum]
MSSPSELDSQSTSSAPFDPLQHMLQDYATPLSTKMSDLGFNDTGSSGVAVTKPFPLFTLEAVRRIRGELFHPDTLSNHLFSDTLNPSVLRGFCPERAPFTHAAWTHPAVQQRINDAAGIDLTTVMDYEIGHTNVQLGPRGWAGLKPEPDLPDTAGALGKKEEIVPTLMVTPNWHKDSYPFVCILMLSESSHLQGGRTVLRRMDGSNEFCDLPPIGYAMVLQGGHIVHAVSPTDTTQERISMVTSYRPADAFTKDISVLKTVRTMSSVASLHRQWCQYRMKVVARRADAMAAKLSEPGYTGCVEEEMGKFVVDQSEYLANTWGEMVYPVASTRTNLRSTYLSWKAEQDTDNTV